MSWVGKSLRRKEDDRLVQGKGLFADDDQTDGMLHLYILRSPYGHARITGIDADAARNLLTYGFGAEILNSVSLEPLREHLDDLVHTRLENRGH